MTTNSRDLAYLPSDVVFTPVTKCPWCSSTSIFQIATRGDGLPVMRCPECHLAFLGEVPDDLSVFYDEGYFARSAIPNSAPAVTGYEDYSRIYSPSSFRWLAMLIRSVLGPDARRVFDLGAATGTFLEAARHEGFEVHGSEINAMAADTARARGLDVSSGAFDPVKWTPGSFDVVTALEVLEHVRDIRTTILDLTLLLPEDGVIVFFVPNVTDEIIDRYGDKALDFNKSYDHTFYFNPQFLSTMSDELFGPGSLTLLTRDVEQWGQGVSAALGFIRKRPVDRPRERVFFDMIENTESLHPIGQLSGYDACTIALMAAKFFDRPRAEVALSRAADAGTSVEQLATVRAQVLRNAGELLSAIELLEDVVTNGGPTQDAMAGQLLIETIEDFLILLRIEQPGLSGGFRELHERFDDMRARLADPDGLEKIRSDLLEVVDSLKQQVQNAEQVASHSLEMLADSRKQASTLEADLADLRRELSNERAMATELGNENARLRNSLNEIYISRAWRLVSGIRSMKSVPRRTLSRLSGTSSTPGPSDHAPSFEATGHRIWKPPLESYPFLVSVIMPVYNKGTTLRSSIESVRAQTLVAVEIVIWDDGSTDPATLSALDEASDLPEVVMFRASNQGVVGARNSAIALSRGRYICCLDPDDQITPTYLEQAVALLESQPQYAITYPWVHSTGAVDELWETQDLQPSLITRANHIPVCAVVRREVFEETGGFSQEMVHGYEDWELWVHAAELGFRGKAIPAHHLKYRIDRDPNQSRDARAKEIHQDLVDEIARLHPRLAKSGVPIERSTPTEVRPVGSELGPRRMPSGSGQPVVLTLPWFTVGGADQAVEALVRHWVEDGRTVVVFLTTPLAPGMSNRRHALEQITPYVYPLNDFLPARQWYEFFTTSVGTLGSPVLFNIGSAWFYESAKSIRRDFPHIRIVDQQFNAIAHQANNRDIAGLIDLTIASYDGLAEEIAADQRPSKVAPVYVGIDEMAPPTADEVAQFRADVAMLPGERLVLFVGRLAAEKRPEWVVRLASDSRLTNAKVVVVGDGPLRDDMAGAVASSDRLIWIPEVDRIEPAIAAADLLILPSKIEGIPLIAMESLALGTPMVATRVGGLPDLEDEEGITLTDPEDFGAFVGAVQKALAVTQGEIHLPERFTSEEMHQHYDKLLFVTD